MAQTPYEWYNQQMVNKKERQQMTAVQWLALRYHHRQGYLSQDDIAEAKAMEKEQIESAFCAGSWHSIGKEINSEQYYKETYNK